MESEIEKKQQIVNVIKQKSEAKELSQEFLLDMQQEINRCNHIMNHMLRSQYNYTGRLAWAGIFSLLGYLISGDRVSTGSKLSIRNAGFMMGSTFVGGLIGFYFIGARNFGSLPDYKKNSALYQKSLIFDKEVEPIVRGFTA